MIASRLQTVLRDSYCACPKLAESIGQQERGAGELTQDSRDTVETEAAKDKYIGLKGADIFHRYTR